MGGLPKRYTLRSRRLVLLCNLSSHNHNLLEDNNANFQYAC